MARIDRKRLAAAEFPVVLEVPTRFDDLDMQGHVNNTAAVVILQEARANFNRLAGLPELKGNLRLMVAALAVEYAREMHHPGLVAVSTGVLAIGRTSFTLGQIARQNGEASLYAQAVMVIADATGPTPMPEALRAALEPLMLTEVEV